jgi:cytochrome b
MDKPEAGSVSGGEVLVWDAVVRLFHWIVVTGCVLDLFVLDDGTAAHRFIGYVVAGALVVRFLWGFLGPGHARFADFVPSITRLNQYQRLFCGGKCRDTLGTIQQAPW